KGGPFAPYRQSERKEIYRQYADQLVAQGNAYYAFDTMDDLEQMREMFKSDQNPSPQYDSKLRNQMRNSISMPADEVKKLLDTGTPHVIRIRMPENEEIHFDDMVRGHVSFLTNTIDDKVLLKADGMPTYHLAVVVDDRLMKITHAFRGEEWLPSSPVHLLLWKYLGWENEMPQWAHLPLILKPDGNGKLSKRDGDRLGFPVFAMNWTDPKTGELTEGFREKGFMPEAFINMLAVLGWNDGSEQELFSLDELVEKFSIGKVHKGGAKFDYEKAKWFNHEWIKKSDTERLKPDVKKVFLDKGIDISDDMLEKIIPMLKERCTFLTDFFAQGSFFLIRPATYDLPAVQPKWNDQKKTFFIEWAETLKGLTDWNFVTLDTSFKEKATAHNIKTGELLLPLRIML
ncbi:MAG: glutamate--tRNA ligase, partial [Chitinophagaceae bacterium]